MSRLILVSNRLPVTVAHAGGEVDVSAGGSGGLVAGLGPVHQEGDGLWFGALKEAEDPQVQAALSRRRLVAVPVPAREAAGHYQGYSNNALWPLFHYLQDELDLTGRDFEAYRLVNERFADAIAREARPDDRIWVHDYHFMLLPALLRRRLPRARIGFFLHIPFPSSEVFRLLPQREALLEGLLGANLIGVHTFDYARHLVSSARRILGQEFDREFATDAGHRCRVSVMPMGIDWEGYRERLADPQVETHLNTLRGNLRNRRIVLGVDRLDYTKGLPLKLEAWERLLQTEPRWRQEAVLVQIANPTRSDIGSYRRLRESVERRVGALNGAMETDGVVPVHYLYRSFPPAELAAWYRAADVAVVTPIRDGLNLVAKEYVACRTGEDGVLVLSEFAGAASEMGEALQVNPWDVDGTARALHQALTMPLEEQRHRMRSLRRRVVASDVRRWVVRFLETLDSAEFKPPAAGPGPRQHLEHELGEAFRQARHRLLILDYDGTLTPLVARPEDAAPAPAVKELLELLAGLPATDVVLISGRDRDTLLKWFGALPVTLVAEHGCVIHMPGHRSWEQLLPDGDFAWMRGVGRVLEEYAARTSGAHVEVKPSALAWHYRQVEPEFGAWQARELANHVTEAFAGHPLEVLHGSKVVEVRHRGINKGAALEALLSEKIAARDLLLLAGDDRTDEDMFAAAPSGAWCLKVGSGASLAPHRVADPGTFTALLAALAAGGDRRPPEAPSGPV